MSGLVAGIITLFAIAGCGDNTVVKQLTPVEMCGQPPAVPAQYWWFEYDGYTSHGVPGQACTAVWTFDQLRDYQEHVTAWQWCIKEIQ